MLNGILRGKFKKEDEAKLISDVEVLASRNAGSIPKAILGYDTRAAEVSLWKQLENDLDEQKRDLLEEFEQETINKQSSKKTLLAQKKALNQPMTQLPAKNDDPVTQPSNQKPQKIDPTKPQDDSGPKSKDMIPSPDKTLQPSNTNTSQPATEKPPEKSQNTLPGTKNDLPQSTSQKDAPPALTTKPTVTAPAKPAAPKDSTSGAPKDQSKAPKASDPKANEPVPGVKKDTKDEKPKDPPADKTNPAQPSSLPANKDGKKPDKLPASPKQEPADEY
jgi:hypothetical protein